MALFAAIGNYSWYSDFHKTPWVITLGMGAVQKTMHGSSDSLGIPFDRTYLYIRFKINSSLLTSRNFGGLVNLTSN